MKKNNILVYLYGFSTWHKAQLKNLSTIIKEQIKSETKIKLVLIHDGVIGFSKKGKISSAILELLNLAIDIYAIQPDLLARGIDVEKIHEKVHIIEYKELVDILAEIPNIVSWL